jgi:hypothetical protein
MYKMNVVLTRVRSHITEQEPPLIREETAFLVYSLAQKHGLRTEALDAARCTLSFSSLTIKGLTEEGKIDIMPGVFLHELWKYHQRVRSNLKSDLEKFRKSNALTIMGDSGCNTLTSGLPYWLDDYISEIGTGRVPAFLDLADFHMRLTGHIRSPLTGGLGCAPCSLIPQKKMRAFWEALMAIVHSSIAKVRFSYVAASPR